MFYGMTGAAVIVLRHTREDLPRPYRVWGYPFTPLFLAFISAYLVADSVRDPATRVPSLWALLATAVPVPVFFLVRWYRGGEGAEVPPGAPRPPKSLDPNPLP